MSQPQNLVKVEWVLALVLTMVGAYWIKREEQTAQSAVQATEITHMDARLDILENSDCASRRNKRS